MLDMTDSSLFLRYGGESLLQIGNDIVDMLGADGKADRVGFDALIQQLLGGKLGVGSGGRVNHQGLYIRHVGQKRENFQAVNKFVSFCLTAINLKGEDGRTTIGKILFIQSVVGMVRQGGVVDLLHLGMIGEKLHHLLGVIGVALQPQGEGFHPLEEQEGIEGGDGCSGVPKKNGPDVGDKGGGTDGVREADPVVAGIGGRNGGVFAGGFPVEFAAVHDDAAQGSAVAADKLGSRVNHNVRPMRNGPNEIGSSEGVVNDQRQAVGVGDLGYGVDVWDVAVGVAQGFQIDRLGVGPDGGGDSLQIVGVHKGGLYSELGQGVCQQVIAAAIDGLLRHNVIPRLGQSLDGVGDGRRARGQCQCRYASLQGGNPLLQHVLGGVGQPPVDVSGIRQAKPGGGVGGIPKHIAGGLVDRNRPGISGGVGLLLAHMKLQCLKLITHGNNPPLSKLTPLYSYQHTLSMGLMALSKILLTLSYNREKWRGFL